MIEFNVAAKAAEMDGDEAVVEVPIDGVVYYARRPTVAQIALLNTTMVGDGTDVRLGAAFDLLESMLGPAARHHLERLAWNRLIDFDDLVGGSEENPEGGLIDQIFEEFQNKDLVERPTQPSAASSSSQASGGRKSTGRSPGKGSTRSPSPSTDS